MLGRYSLTARKQALFDGRYFMVWSLELLKGSMRLTGALHLLVGFFVGCVVATAALMYLGDWAWALPASLAGVAVTLR